MATFLTLPRELRDAVYRHVTELSVQTPPQSYADFYVACKQIKQEIDEETRRPLDWLQSNTLRPRVEVPVTSFNTLRNARFHMTADLASAAQESKSVLQIRQQQKAPRIWLHNIILRYNSWDDAPTRLNHASALACIGLLKELNKLPISTRQIILEITTTDGSHQALLLDHKADPCIFRAIGKFWEIETFPSPIDGGRDYFKITISKLHGFQECS